MDLVVVEGLTVYQMIFYFFIYAFLGWVCEVAFAALKTGKFVNRGFLNGPLCPIYGCGVVIVMLFLAPIRDKWYLVFLAGAIVATLLELVTGFVLEKVFHTKWWDYTKEPFNIKGYVCLRFTIIWGIAILLLFNTIVPQIEWLVNIIPRVLGLVIVWVFIATFIADFIVTIMQLNKLNKQIKQLDKISQEMKKSSDKIGKAVSIATLAVKEKLEVVGEKLEPLEEKIKTHKEMEEENKTRSEMEKKLAKNRLLKAFPSLQTLASKLSEIKSNGIVKNTSDNSDNDK